MQKNQPLKDEDADVQKNIEHKYDVTDFYWDPKDSPVVVGLCTNKHFENTTFAVIGVSRQCFCEMIRCERIRHMIIFSGSTCALSWFFKAYSVHFSESWLSNEFLRARPVANIEFVANFARSQFEFQPPVWRRG